MEGGKVDFDMPHLCPVDWQLGHSTFKNEFTPFIDAGAVQELEDSVPAQSVGELWRELRERPRQRDSSASIPRQICVNGFRVRYLHNGDEIVVRS